MKIEEVTAAMEREQTVLHTHMGITVRCRITGCITRYSKKKGWHYALELAELKSNCRIIASLEETELFDEMKREGDLS